MKYFIKKLFISIPLIFIITTVIYYTNHPNWSVGYEVEEAKNIIATADTSITDTIRIGDSVGKNFFGTQADSNGINLCTSAGVSILGHTLLLKELLKKSKGKKWHVHGYFKPSSILSNMQSQYTNNYFIKKFYNNYWLFDPDLIPTNLANYIDSTYLVQHSPYKQCIRYTWINEFSIFNHPEFGNNKEPKNYPSKNYIINTLLKSELRPTILNIQFKSVPIHPAYYEAEFKDYKRLKLLGLNIEQPKLLAPKYFINDKTHIIPADRNRTSYYKLMQID